ncbi:MAG: Calx-beta domain-containing protein, partial [Acidimicrobiales bacterium]
DEPPLLWGEWGLVAFSNPANAVLDTTTFFGHGLFIITDDEPDLPVITPRSVGISDEGDSGSTFWDLPVTLSAPSTVPVSIDWATVNTSTAPQAQSGSDFVAASGTLTFQPGQTVQSISLEILGDTVDEPPLLWGEWGLVAFSNPANAVLDTTTFFGHGLFIIVDDDP